MLGSPPSSSIDARVPSWAPRLRRQWGDFVVFAALMAVLALLYGVSAVEVQLTVDGKTTRVATRASTVRDLLIERNVAVDAGDLALPGPDARIDAATHVIVQRARPARVRADGAVVRLRSHGQSVLALLAEADVPLAPGDEVTVNGRPWPVDRTLPETTGRDGAQEALDVALRSGGLGGPFAPARSVLAAESDDLQIAPPSAFEQSGLTDDLLPGDESEWVVDVWRAVPVTVEEGDATFVLQLAGPSVGAALQAAGIELYPEDVVWPSADARLEGGGRIVIERATSFIVEADGARRTLRAVAKTIGDGLDQAGFSLLGRDYAIPAADTPLTNGIEVKVIRVKEDFLVLEVPIGFATQHQPDSSMVLDDKRVDRPGEPGLKSQRIRITYEDGEEIDRELVEEVVLREPVAEIVSYGTQIAWNTVSTPQGPKQYWRKMRVYATSYSLARSGTSPSAPWYGFTRSGLPMRHGIVAVDRRFIPFMSNLYVPDYGLGMAADTGGGVRSYHIDLGYDDDNYQSWHWPVDLYLLEPLPDEDSMIWLLP